MPTPALLHRRQALVKQLARLEPLILRGSLIERYKRCGHPGCKCSTGPGTRAQVLPVGQPGRRPTRDGLRPEEYSKQVSDYLQNFQKVRQVLETDLQYQPRVVTAPSEVLTPNAHGAFILIPARSRLGWDPRRQFFAELVASRLWLTNLNSSRDLP